MKFSAITTILSLAALAIAAPTVEVAARGDNSFAANCDAKGGSAYCCTQVTPASSEDSTLPINLSVLVGCLSLLLSSPICSTSTVCCSAPAQSDPALVGILDGAQVCPSIPL